MWLKNFKLVVYLSSSVSNFSVPQIHKIIAIVDLLLRLLFTTIWCEEEEELEEWKKVKISFFKKWLKRDFYMKRKERERIEKRRPKIFRRISGWFCGYFFLCIVAAFHVVYTHRKNQREEEEHLAKPLFSKWAIWLLMGAYWFHVHTRLYIRDEDQFYVAAIAF